MSTSFSEVLEVKAFLRQQHIIVSEEWTEACISFLKQEQPSLASQGLKKRVHQQWLIADLEEIACPSLPQELPTAQKMILNGNFALQIQGIRDISKPAYSQLKELTNDVNVNVEFTSAPKAAVPEWEAKPTRMLMLALTDGCTKVQGMEYRIINFLSPNFPPGIKVLIKGPIECRFGVLMLTSENISILGGAVESKLEQFSRENLLREQLQLERENVDQSEVTEITIDNNQELSMNSRTSNSNNQMNRNQQNQINSRMSSQNSNSSTSLTNYESNAEDVLDHFDSDDDFEQNIDYGVLDEIENSQRQSNTSQELNEYNEPDVWQEDEDMVRELMEFQDADPEFKMPFDVCNPGPSTDRSSSQNSSVKEVFTYLSAVTNNPASECIITIKGFIITVLSKLEIIDSGWSITVKVNDGTASINANMHDKVLEDIMGVSAQTMRKIKAEAARNIEVRTEMHQILNKCKVTLQNFNGLMDIKFTPGEKPCIMKCTQVSKSQIQQLLERVSSNF